MKNCCVILFALVITTALCGNMLVFATHQGDIDGNDAVNAKDYLMLKSAILGTYILSEQQLRNSDIDGDGKVGAKDYMMLKRSILGTYEMPQVPSDDTEYITAHPDMSEPISQYTISYKILSKHDLNAEYISFEICYGLLNGCDADVINCTNIKVYAKNDDGVYLTIKDMDILDITDPKYVVERVWDGMWIADFIYTYTETVEIPMSFFANDSGWILLGLSEYATDVLGKEYIGAGAYAEFCYKKDGNCVLISSPN